MMLDRCTATKRSGEACSGRPILQSEYCVSHHPDSSEWRKKGGRNKSNLVRAHNRMPDGLKPVVDGLLNGFDEVPSGDLEPRQLSAMAQGATALIKLAEFVLLEERLMALEERLNERPNPKA